MFALGGIGKMKCDMRLFVDFLSIIISLHILSLKHRTLAACRIFFLRRLHWPTMGETRKRVSDGH